SKRPSPSSRPFCRTRTFAAAFTPPTSLINSLAAPDASRSRRRPDGLALSCRRLAVMKPLSECRLYTFVDTAYLRSRTPPEVAQQLCDGGSDLIQLRAKNSSPDEIRRMAETIFPITAKAGVWLVINDHPQIAAE